MELRFTFHDSETGEEDTVDFEANITELTPNAGPLITQAFSEALAKRDGEAVVDIVFDALVPRGDVAAMICREKVTQRGGQSYDILITGLVYSCFN